MTHDGFQQSIWLKKVIKSDINIVRCSIMDTDPDIYQTLCTAGYLSHASSIFDIQLIKRSDDTLFFMIYNY